MSWNIAVHVERIIEDGGEYAYRLEYVCCLHDNFKWYIDNDYFDSLPVETEFSKGLNDIYDSLNSAKVVSPADLMQYAVSLIDKCTAIKKTIWCALGLPEYTDDEYTDISSDKYDSSGNIDPNWNQLTFPVNKELFDKLQEADFGSAKGFRILGMLDSLEAQFDSTHKYRLVLVRE